MRIGNIKLFHVLNAAARHAMPFRKNIRHIKRVIFPYDDNPDNSNYCITNGLEQITALRDAGISVRDKIVLEFGTGWMPLIPWLFHLAGTRRLILTDIDRLLDQQTLERARLIIRHRIDDIVEVLQEPEDVLLARLYSPMSFDYVVPWDAKAQPNESVDLVVSRATFEHIPVDRLEFFLRQFYRILRPGGAMCHLVDNSDHWQHRDRTLSRVNFLRFAEGNPFWKIAQFNPQSFQNRARHGDYINMMRQSGFLIKTALGTPDEKSLQDICNIPLNDNFKGKSAEELSILISLFVVTKPFN